MSLIFGIFGLCWHDWRIFTVEAQSRAGDYLSIDIKFCINHDCGKRCIDKVYLNGELM